MKMYDPEIARITDKVTEEEKKRCKETIEELYRFADKARRDGLLSLEDELTEEMPDFLWIGVRMMIDGEVGELIEKTLRHLLHSRAMSNGEIVERLIIIEGIRGILEAETPSVLKVVLTAFLGEAECKTALQ
jgi:flagellar motor component MotA